MPKAKKTAVKLAKQKLTPEERSQVAKDRWAKRRSAKAAQEMKPEASPDAPLLLTNADMITPDIPSGRLVHEDWIAPVPPPVEQKPSSPSVVSAVAAHEASIADLNQAAEALKSALPLVTAFIEPPPSPQLAPVKAPKQKRTPVPKEFLVALRTADTRLAKAIEEYEDCQQRITYLAGAIPRLQRTVLALRNESNPDALMPSAGPTFNYPAPSPMPQFQPPQDPLAAIQAAMAAPPVSRATGGTVQFSPDVVGELEGPEEDEDQFLKGPAAGSKGWI